MGQFIVVCSILLAGTSAQADENVVETAAQNARATDQAQNSSETVAPPGANTNIKVAVYNLKLNNVPEGIGHIVTTAVLDEIRKLEAVSAIGMDEIRDMLSLERQKQTVGCDESESCLAEIAMALGVDEIISGSLVERHEGRTFILRRIDQQRAKVIFSVTKRLEVSNGEEFLLAIGPIIQTLYPSRKLRAGTERGVSERVVLKLNPPPIPTWATYTSMGATAVAGIFSGISYVVGNQIHTKATNEAELAASHYRTDTQRMADAQTFIDYQADVDRWNGIFQASWMTTASLALTTGLMSIWTDWMGYADEAE